ncbi:MAG TPA: TetR/AcrR family transcriptional regulator [Acidimicrobiia bacterium]|nr:TetR/AcrR family transcriptional regulator [Acidimicrobiia bacterium]
MGRPKEHDEETAQALLKAGEELLGKGGVPAISVRAVVDRAGTTTRAVYALFGSKAGLVEAIAARGYLLLADSVNALPRTDDPRADLVDVGGVFRAFAIGHPALFRLTFERAQAEVFSSDRVRQAAVAAYEALIDLIERAQESGDVDPSRAPDEIAYMIHSVCQGLAGSELAALRPPIGAGMWLRLGDFDRSKGWETVLNAVVDGLAP